MEAIVPVLLWSADHRTSVMTKYEAGLMLDVTNQLEILHTVTTPAYQLPIMCQSPIISIAVAILLQDSGIQVIDHDLTPFPFRRP